MKRKKFNYLMFAFTLLFLIISMQQQIFVEAAVGINCPFPTDFNSESKELIAQKNIPTSILNGKYKLNGNYLANECGLGSKAVVYGTPANVPGNQSDQGQWRYLGYDINGNIYRNWNFRSDSRATLNVAKNWVKNPWNEPVGRSKKILETPEFTYHPDAARWFETMIDPYKESPTFLQSYNKRTNKGWTGATFRDYAIIQQVPTLFSPGIVQMWNIWQPDGSWWYEMFYIPPLDPLEVKQLPDLVITDIKTDPVGAASASWVGDNVTVQITSKNEGNANTGPFTVGIVGTSIKSEVISNVPPGQIKTVSVKVTSAVAGIIKYTAKTDFGEAVVESNENNNTKPFQIVFSKKNEPTTPIAIISHLEGDHRTKPEITIKPAAEPKLDDKLSYSPGKEAITLQEWKYKTPAGTTIQKKPTAKDFTNEGKYLVELRVTNSAKKVSEWSELTVNVATNATPNPGASPTPTPQPTPTPRPELVAKIEFVPSKIITGESSSLINRSTGLNGYTWKFSDNLKSTLPNMTDYEFNNIKYSTPGNYIADITVTDDLGGSRRATATLHVIDPKPVAIVSGISRVIQGRPLDRPYNLLNSYTPLEDRGEKIDFSKSEMRYKKVGNNSYINNWFTTTPSELGEYSIEGKVYDTTGRVSDWGSMIMEVVPDAPPTVSVIAPEESYRENGFMLYIDAESPDGDILTHLLLEERYDQDGNGNFEEEVWTTLYNGAYKTTHNLKYNKVGKRQYRATVTEDYGLKGQSGIATTDILNYAPSVNFNAFGVTQQPGQGEDSAPPLTNYSPESILRSWTIKNPYVGGNGNKLAWKADTTALSTKKGLFPNFTVGYPDSGNGANARSKYDLAEDITAMTPWLLTNGETPITVISGNQILTRPQSSAAAFNIRNSITGQLLSTITIPGGVKELLGIFNETLYYAGEKTNSTYVIEAYNLNGVLLDTYQINYTQFDPVIRSSIISFEISPDGQYMYLVATRATDYVDLQFGWYYNTQVAMYKYNLKTKSLVYESILPKGDGKSNVRVISTSILSDGSYVVGYEREYSGGGHIVRVDPYGTAITVRTDTQAISRVVVSDDNKHFYVLGQTTGSKPYFLHYFYDNGKFNHNWQYDMTAISHYVNKHVLDTPLIGRDGIVSIVYPYNSDQRMLFSYTGSHIGLTSYAYNGYQSMDKFYIDSKNRVIHPAFFPDYLEPDGLVKFGINNKLENTSIVRSIGLPASYGRNPARKATNILPDGSMYFFVPGAWDTMDNTYIIPFVSKTGSGIKEIDPNTIEVSSDTWGGLLYDAGSSMKNYALEFNVSVNDMTNDKVIGAGFQIQNEKNMYAMEWNKNTLSLYRVVNGTKTLLKSTPMASTAFNTYPIKVESVNGIQRVYVNHSKVLEAADGTYTKGFAGILSLGQSNAVFSNVKKTNYGDTYTQETYDSVLVNDPISYEKLFNDIEKDPIGAEEWSYSHNPNFFENPEGISVHNGKTYGTTINALEKPGVYEITFRAQDNPGLMGYRKWSEPVKKLIYVHRRPVAQPDVRFTGMVYAEGESLDYETFDKSYDPDVAHILSEKLFRTRWADETTWTTGKRQYYNRPGVELIVQEQVRDIHGAWSYWGQTIVYKPGLPPVNQTKPVMTITVPAGTTPTTPTTYVKEPTIRWTYYDAQNDPQEGYRLTLTYVDKNETIISLEHEGNALTYPVLEGTIQKGRVVKVQGQVYSKGVWSDLSNIRYFVLNQPPQTTLLSFNGPNSDNPIYTNTNRPLLRVFTVDPENHPIKAIDYEVYQASNGAKVVDTESTTAAASYTPAALAEGLHYWKARANDGYSWGPYSSNGFFFVDTVKPADVDEQLDIKPTSVTVKFNAFSDAQPSSGHASRKFYLQKVNANGSVTNIDLDGDGTTEYSIPLQLNQLTYKVNGLVPGQQYRVTVIDNDIAGNEGHYAYIYFSTNRPPTADFDWSPKPVYEGDLTTFTSQAADPDGDPLSVVYELTSPLGVKNTYSYTLNGPAYPAKGPALRMLTVGLWSMKMTVSDGMAEPVVVTKSVQVLPLGLNGFVKHTELWDQHRKTFNLKTSGNEETPRGYSVFWAGEKFVLEAETTLTGTDTRADRVLVQMGQFKTDLLAERTLRSKWTGELWDAAFAKLAKGPLEFIFTAYYNNGTVITTRVNVTIDGQTIEIVGVHRVN